MPTACSEPHAPLPPGPPPDTIRVNIGGRTFELELAIDVADQVKGLGGRDRIDPQGGMIFLYGRPVRHGFVMRDCPVPIDIIFVDPGGGIVATHQMQPEPGRPEEALKVYSSDWPFQYAIELAGGSLDELALEPGGKIDLPLAELKRWVP